MPFSIWQFTHSTVHTQQSYSSWPPNRNNSAINYWRLRSSCLLWPQVSSSSLFLWPVPLVSPSLPVPTSPIPSSSQLSWSMQLHIQTKHSWSSSLVFGKRAINPMGLMSSMQSECCYPCSLRPLSVRSNYTPAGTAVSFWFQQGCELSPGVVRCLLGFLMLVTSWLSSVYIHRYTRLLNKDTCWTVRGVSPPNA